MRYGDGRVYAELARRFEATGRLDTTGDDLLRFRVREVAQHGRDWAIPILVRLLGYTETKWKRWGTGPLCSAAPPEWLARLFVTCVLRLLDASLGPRQVLGQFEVVETTVDPADMPPGTAEAQALALRIVTCSIVQEAIGRMLDESTVPAEREVLNQMLEPAGRHGGADEGCYAK